MANRFFVAGGVDNNWGTTGNWSASSGGAGGETVPTATDAVFLDGNSPDCTLDTTLRNAQSIDFTGYTNTITFTQGLQIGTGNITLAAGMTFAGTGTLFKNSAGTITSNGKAFTIPLDLGGNVTYTLADDLDVDSAFTIGQSTTQTINGNTVHVGGNFLLRASVGGTAAFLLDGTGTWQGGNLNTSGGVTINTAGTITFVATIGVGDSLTYVAGTVVTTGSRLRIGTGNPTWAIGGITLNDFEVGRSGAAYNGTLTLAEDVNVGGTFIFAASTSQTINGNQILISGGITGQSTGVGAIRGTTIVVLQGTGTVVWALDFAKPLIINTAGTITLSGSLNFNTGGTLTYVAGTVVGGAGVTVNVATGAGGGEAIVTFDLNDLVLDANFRVFRSGPQNVQLSLASGIEIVAGRTVTLTGANGSQLTTLQSSSGGVQRKFTLQAGVIMNIRFNTAIDMDSGDGQRVFWRKPGSISNTINWSENARGAGNPGGPPGGGGGTTQQNPFSAEMLIIGNAGASTD